MLEPSSLSKAERGARGGVRVPGRGSEPPPSGAGAGPEPPGVGAGPAPPRTGPEPPGAAAGPGRATGGAEGTAPAARPGPGGARPAAPPGPSLSRSLPLSPGAGTLSAWARAGRRGAAALSPPLETCIQPEPPLAASPDPPQGGTGGFWHCRGLID